jgi:lysine/ornithine N-monooxygenase
MRDSNRFFYHYNAAPNSIWKANYDAYCVHVRNVLSSIKEYTDSDINRISSVTANAFADAASKYTTDDPNYQAAQRVNDTVQEAIVIR